MASTPPNLLALSESFYFQQQQTARSSANAAQSVWRGMPEGSLATKWDWWDSVVPSLTDLVALSQFTNATRAGDYVSQAAGIQDVSVAAPDPSPLAFVSATEDVEAWVVGAMARYSSLIVDGAPDIAAKTSGLASLLRVVATLPADSGREATGAGIAAHPHLSGYFRRLRTPSCGRCAVLAGAFYRWSHGFKRHPLCDCVHVPAATDYDDGGFDASEAVKAGQVTGLSADETRAILDGADPSQVVNARRNGAVQTSQMFGRTVQTTTSGTTLRGVYGSGQTELKKAGGRYRVAKVPRLTPSEIYRQASSKSEAARLLEKYGYLA